MEIIIKQIGGGLVHAALYLPLIIFFGILILYFSI